MTFKDLTPEDLEYLSFIYHEEMKHVEKMDILTSKFNVSERSIRRWWKEELKLTENLSNLPKQLLEAKDREIPEDTDILLVTSAQNKTGVNREFLKNLEAYKLFLENLGKRVEIVISPQRYRNPTNLVEDQKKKAGLWWMDEVLPYLHYGKLQFGDTKISTNSRIRPTASNPLQSYEVLAKDNNLILPHSKIHFKTLPRFKNAPLRTMSTTGYITRKNYSETKAGEKGYEHHSYGFVIVEKKPDGTCHIPRNVKVTDEGDFVDIIFQVKDEKVTKVTSTEGFIWGDMHERNLNWAVFYYTLNTLYPILNPKETILHDVFDGATVNPHEKDDFFIQKWKIKEGKHLVQEEVEDSFSLVKKVKDTGSKVNVVLSNHDVFLDRYVNNGNWKKDLHNSESYLKYALNQKKVNIRKYGTIYGYLLHKEFDGEVEYLNYGDSLNISGYETGLHADNGTNGARGSARTFAKLNTKMIGGHSHSPVILDGYTGVGVTCEINQYYTRKGLSSWAYAHSVIHPNGKNQLLVLGDDLKLSGLI